MRDEIAKPCLAVIASEAKQSMSQHIERMDCFVAEPVIGRVRATRWLLAMTPIQWPHTTTLSRLAARVMPV